MRIAIVSQPFDGVLPPHQNSIGIWTANVSPRLTAKHAVTVYSKRYMSFPKEVVEQNVQHRLMRTVPARIWHVLERRRPVDQPLFASKLFYYEYILQIAMDIRKRGFDIVHVMNFSQFAPVIRALNPDVKIVLHMQCEWLSQLDRDTIEKRLQSVDYVVGTSEYITDKVRQRFPQHAEKCRTIYNGVEFGQLISPEGASRNSGSDPARLLFVGRISPEKGVHVLFDAFNLVAERIPGIEMDIVGPAGVLPLEYLVGLSADPRVQELTQFYTTRNGSGELVPYFEQVKARVKEEFADRIHFIGFVPHAELDPYFRRAHVFINSSLSDAFPLPVPEAMGAGLPVVGSRVGGVPEAVVDGETGYLVEPGDANQLANAILRLLEDEPLRKRMSENAYKRALDVFSWDAISKRVEWEYASLGRVN